MQEGTSRPPPIPKRRPGSIAGLSEVAGAAASPPPAAARQLPRQTPPPTLNTYKQNNMSAPQKRGSMSKVPYVPVISEVPMSSVSVLPPLSPRKATPVREGANSPELRLEAQEMIDGYKQFQSEHTPTETHDLYLKIHFPWFLWKVMRFQRSMTVGEAVKYIQTKRQQQGMDDPECGLFIPAWYGNTASGWLTDDRTLASYNLANNDLVEFREKRRNINVQSKIGKFEVEVEDTATISDCMKDIVNKIGEDNIFEVSGYPERQFVVLLDKGVLLLHLPIPYNAQFVVLKDSSSGKYSLYVKIPHFQGMLYKRGDTGLKRTWKKRWFMLQKDKVVLYKDPFDKKAMGFVPIQRVKGVKRVAPPTDATSVIKALNLQGSDDCCFLLQTLGKSYMLISPDNSVKWRNTIEEWLRFKEFFGPEQWLSQQFFDRNVEQAHPETLASTSRQTVGYGGANTLAPRKGSGNRLSVRQSRRLRALSMHVDPGMQLAIESALKEAGAVPATQASSSASASASASSSGSSATSANKNDVNTQQKPPARKHSVTAMPQIPISPMFDIPPMSEDDGDGSESEEEIEITVATSDGTLIPLIVDICWEVYDLVYVIGEEIGSHRVPLISDVDIGETRRVELLDHQKPLRDHQLPSDAVFILKKTGIVDEFIGPDDIYDNHFLYVQLPKVEGYLELKRPGSDEWVRYWTALKADKILFFESQNSLRPSGKVGLFLVSAVSKGVNDDPQQFSVETTRLTLYFRCKDGQRQLSRWADTVDGWKYFWAIQSAAARRRAILDEHTSFESFFRASEEVMTRRTRTPTNEIQKTDSPFWQYLQGQQADFEEDKDAGADNEFTSAGKRQSQESMQQPKQQPPLLEQEPSPNHQHPQHQLPQEEEQRLLQQTLEQQQQHHPPPHHHPLQPQKQPPLLPSDSCSSSSSPQYLDAQEPAEHWPLSARERSSPPRSKSRPISQEAAKPIVHRHSASFASSSSNAITSFSVKTTKTGNIIPPSSPPASPPDLPHFPPAESTSRPSSHHSSGGSVESADESAEERIRQLQNTLEIVEIRAIVAEESARSAQQEVSKLREEQQQMQALLSKVLQHLNL